MAFPEFCWYTVISKPCTLRATYYPFGPQKVDIPRSIRPGVVVVKALRY